MPDEKNIDVDVVDEEKKEDFIEYLLKYTLKKF